MITFMDGCDASERSGVIVIVDSRMWYEIVDRVVASVYVNESTKESRMEEMRVDKIRCRFRIKAQIGP